MIHDEFNKVEITNEKQIGKIEFGKTQKTEFSFHKDNKVPEAELNDKFTTHQTSIKKDVKSADLLQKNVSLPASTGGVSVASTSASSIAAASTSVVAVASVVTVTAISVATGISVALHNYQYKFNSFLISSNEVTYDLSIFDLNENDEESYQVDDYLDYQEEEEKMRQNTFNLRVYNKNYDYTHELWLGNNYGTFQGLTLGEKYYISLSESRYGGETIFEEEFVTKSSSSIKSFELFNEADFISNVGYAQIEYVDEANELSDFTLSLTSNATNYKVDIALEKTLEKQEIYLIDSDNNKLDLSDSYSYVFSYQQLGKEKVFKEGEINFFDISGGQSVFNDFILDSAADFLTGEFSVRLDYIDDFNYFSDFTLSFVGFETSEETIIPLEKTTETQIINANDYHLDLRESYTYSLNCLLKGNEETLFSSSVTFSDSLGRETYFTELIFDGSADLLERTFPVQLNYRDDFGYYSEFVLTLTNLETEEKITIPLKDETTVQVITASDYNIDLSVSYWYELSCLNDGFYEVLTSGNVEFFDSQGRETTFNKFIFNKTMDFDTGEFVVQLDYVDTFNYLSEFELSFTNADLDAPIVIYLESKTSEQIINGFEYEIYFENTYTYTLSCLNNGVKEVLESDEVTFTDSLGRTFIFNDFNLIGTANFITSEFDVNLDFVDDFGYFDNFSLNLMPVDSVNENDKMIIPLEATSGIQTIRMYDYYEEFDFKGSYSCSLSYSDRGNEMLVIGETSFTFENNSGFNGVEFEGIFDIVTEDVGIQLDYDESLNRFSNFSLHLDCVEVPEVQYNVELDDTSALQTFNTKFLDIQTDYSYTYYVVCLYDDAETMVAEGGPITFHDPDAVSKVNGITFINGEASFDEDRNFEVQLDYQDDYHYFDDFTLIIYDLDNDSSKTFDLSSNTDVQSLSANSKHYDEDLGDDVLDIDIAAHSLAYNLSYTTTENGSAETVTLYDENQTLYFENSLHTAFNGLVTSYDFITTGEDTYSLPFKFDYIDEAERYSNVSIDIEYDNGVKLAQIVFPDELFGHEWINGEYISYSSSNEDIVEATNGSLYNLVVYASVKNDRTGITEDDVVLWQEKKAFTLDQNTEIYGLTLDTMLLGDDLEATASQVFFAGESSSFDECVLVIELDNGTVYTYSFTLSDYFYVALASPDEDEFDRDEFNEQMETGVKVSVRYSLTSDPGVTKTVLCYTDLFFAIGV